MEVNRPVVTPQPAKGSDC